VIRVNQDRAAKRLWTERGGGEPVRLIPVYDEQEEALTVCGEIERLIGNESYSLSDFAVLYRTNAQSRAFEDVLLRRGIPTAWWGVSASTSARRSRTSLPTSAWSPTPAIRWPSAGS